MYITGEKNLQTIWEEMTEEFKDLQWINITKDSIWNTTRDHKMNHPLTPEGLKLTKGDQSRETITQTRFWRLRPDDNHDIVFRPPTETQAVIFCILEFKRMSDVTDQYLIRSRSRAEHLRKTSSSCKPRRRASSPSGRN